MSTESESNATQLTYLGRPLSLHRREGQKRSAEAQRSLKTLILTVGACDWHWSESA